MNEKYLLNCFTIILCILFLLVTDTQGKSKNAYLGFINYMTDESTNYTVIDEYMTENVAGLIAAYHCENKDGSIVPELGRLRDKCPEVEFSMKINSNTLNPKLAVQNFKDHFLNNTIDYVIGAVYSTITQRLATFSGAFDIPMTSFWSTSDQLSNPDLYDQFSRTIPSDKLTALAMVKVLAMYNITHAGMIYEDDTYGSGYRDSLQTEAKNYNISIISRQFTTINSLENAMESMNQRKLNVIVCVVYSGEHFNSLLDYIRVNKLNKAGTLLLFTDSISDDDVTEYASKSKAHRETIMYQQRVIATGGSQENPNYNNFEKRWKQFGHDDQLIEYLNKFMPGGPNFKQNREIKIKNYTIEKSFFNDTLGSIRYFAPFAYDAVVFACNALCVSESKYGNFSGALIHKIIKEDNSPIIEFEGVSGYVKLLKESASRDPLSANFELASIIPKDDDYYAKELAFTSIGRLNSGSSQILFDPPAEFYFPGKVKSKPTTTPKIVEKTNLIDPGLRTAGLVIMGLTQVSCVIFIIWTIIKRKSKQVMKSQPQFLIIFLLGIIISSLTVLFISVDEGFTESQSFLDISCNLHWATWSIGSTIVTSALLVKTYRILRIFKNPALKKVTNMHNVHLYVRISMLVIVDLIILLVWYLTSPAKWVRQDFSIDEFGNTLESFGYCYSSGSSSFILLLLIYNFILFAIAVYVCYKVRNVNAEFQESTYFFIAMVMQFQLYILGLPVVIAIGASNTGLTFFVLAMLIGFNNFILLMLIMAPKVFPVFDFVGSNKSMNDNNESKFGTALTDKKSLNMYNSSNMCSKYTKNNEDIYSVYEDNEEFEKALKLQRPSIEFGDLSARIANLNNDEISSTGPKVIPITEAVKDENNNNNDTDETKKTTISAA